MKRLLITASLAAAGLLASAEPADSTAHGIDEVVVTGTRNSTDIRHLPMTISVVGRDKLTEKQRTNVLPTLSEQVPGLFVTARSIAGYAVSDGRAGDISIRGLGSGAGRIMVLIDGHPQYQGIFGHSISDSYQTLMAEQVEVLRGPASMLYGSNAMGGVINIVTRKMPADGVKTDINIGAGSYGTFQSELTNRIRKGKFYSILAGQYSRSDNHRRQMDFEQYGGYLKLGYDISQNWNVYADADITHFNASYPGSVQVPVYDARQWITRGVVSAAVENKYERTSGALSAYYNFGRHKINDGYEDGEEPQKNYFRSDDALIGLSFYQSAQLFRGNRITVGADMQHIYGKAWNKVIATGEDLAPIGDESENEIAVYADFRQDITPWLTVDAGIRADHHSQAGTEWIPQGGLVFRTPRDGELKAMVSKGYRNPTIREMYFWRPANSDLRPERMINYEISWKQRLMDGAFRYGVNLFYINGDNLIQNVRTDNGPKNINTGAIENSGIEAEWAWRIDRHWALNNNYSLLHMHNKVVAAPEFKGFIGASYKNGRWKANAGLQYIDGLYTETGAAETKENFCLLDLSVSYEACRNITLWGRGENLLAQKYEINRGYPMPRATFMGGVMIRL